MAERYERKEAAALAFDPEKHDAPVVVAAGSGMIAENILRVAEESGVPVVPDKGLAHVLNQLSVGDAIPPELYAVVAQVLVYVSQIDEDFGKRMAKAR